MEEYLGYGIDNFIDLFGDCAKEEQNYHVRVSLGNVDVSVTYDEWTSHVEVCVEFCGRVFECVYDGCDSWYVNDVLDACDRGVMEAVEREARDFKAWND